ncbi:MAG TPA: thioredoxin-disulfide reductase [Candidatus Hydrogenedentes bacterium]|nr:thioredoxin-disulfide reductase [Candidatus Hydrogenedentota bacterium]
MERVVIIGSGPAAFTAAIYAGRANLQPLVFEGELSKEMLPGGQLMTTTEVENFPGFPDGVSGPQIMDLFKRQAQRFGANVVSRTVTAADLNKRPFKIFSGNEAWETEAVIIATGATAKYLGLESEEKFMNRGVSACATCDGALPRFRGKPVVVVGGGDTAIEEALFLANFASRVHVIHRRDKLRASKIMGDRAMANPRITIEWNSVVDEILGDDSNGVIAVRVRDVHSGETRDIQAAGYFSAIGHEPNTGLFRGVLDMDAVGYLKVEPGTSKTNVAGVFAAGDVADPVYRQAITAAGSGCKAALDCARWLEAQHA